MLRKAHDLMTRVHQLQDEDNAEFVTIFSKATKMGRHIFTARKRNNPYVRRLRPSVWEEMLKELLLMTSNFRSSIIDSRRIPAGKKGSTRAFMEQVQLEIDKF